LKRYGIVDGIDFTDVATESLNGSGDFLDGNPQEVIERLSKLAPLERLGKPQDIRASTDPAGVLFSSVGDLFAGCAICRAATRGFFSWN
jgi:hypothetical protein